MDTTSSRMLPQATPAGASGISKKEQERPKTAAHNAFYVQLKFSHAKTCHPTRRLPERLKKRSVAAQYRAFWG